MRKSKRVLITVGGTGGHIYPALALARQLITCEPMVEVAFAGGGLTKNRYFSGGEFPFYDISCGTIGFNSPWLTVRNTFRIYKGIRESRQVLQEVQPNLIVGFGSYYTFPLLVSGILRKVPFILHEANRIPGRVNRLLSQHAACVGVQFPDAAQFLKGTVFPVPLPLREDFHRGAVDKERALDHYHLELNKKTLLVFGGSQGAQAINSLIIYALARLPSKEGIQVIHITGTPLASEPIQREYARLGINACVKDFEPRMDLAWQAADCALARAGAGTIAEALEFEVPAIFVPYPYATDNHQESNARFVIDVVKAGELYREADVVPVQIAQTLHLWLQKGPQVLEKMRKAMHQYKKQANFSQLIDVVRRYLT